MANKMQRQLTPKDYEYIQSLSAAVLSTTPRRLRMVLYFWIAAIALFIVWAALAKVDEIARGNGQVVSSAHNKMIQHLEGGIVEEIMVKEGQSVKANQPLLKIKNEKSTASFQSNELGNFSLQAKLMRLKAEAGGGGFSSAGVSAQMQPYIQNELSLLHSNRSNLQAKISGLQEKLSQNRQELSEAKSRKDHLKQSLNMINEEVRMTGPMVEKGVRSKVDYLKLQREANEAEAAYQSTLLSIPRLESVIQETSRSIEEARSSFRSEAQTQYNEVLSQYNTMQADKTALTDQVDRTTVRAPMDGIIQSLFIHTVGGVVKPGDDLIEIVPKGEKLVVDVKIKPSDIAFIYPGQRAVVKLSAYDFSVYGALEGKVTLISADTVADRKEETYYTVRIETNKSYVQHNGKRLAILPGMTLSADIITGQKSILDYIMKPILKTKQHMLSER
ncbi:MAG: HlyD family type I secretion periplasmic adaptor subunit [Sulfuricurvum sp.]|nr:HlyD family type I secretion periplasmic adaptor subunit [Sulfuricurvum sp.]